MLPFQRNFVLLLVSPDIAHIVIKLTFHGMKYDGATPLDISGGPGLQRTTLITETTQRLLYAPHEVSRNYTRTFSSFPHLTLDKSHTQYNDVKTEHTGSPYHHEEFQHDSILL